MNVLKRGFVKVYNSRLGCLQVLSKLLERSKSLLSTFAYQQGHFYQDNGVPFGVFAQALLFAGANDN